MSTETTTKKTKRRPRSTWAGKKGWQAVFLESLSKLPHVSIACEAAKIDRTTAYGYRKRHLPFAEAWDNALLKALNTMEASVWKRGCYGVKKNVWMKDENGKPVKVDEIIEYDTTAAIFMLKAHDPAKYRERHVTELTGPNNAPLEVNMQVRSRFMSALERAYGSGQQSAPEAAGEAGAKTEGGQ